MCPYTHERSCVQLYEAILRLSKAAFFNSFVGVSSRSHDHNMCSRLTK